MKDTEEKEDVVLTSWADDPIMVSALAAAIAVFGGTS